MFKENPKLEYINKEIWILTIGAAFQRAYIYKKEISDYRKDAFKSKLKNFIEASIVPQYRSKVDEDKHITNIVLLSNFTCKYSDMLKAGKLNFGVGQKLLNLFLIYLWCLDHITEPPHFPVDRRFQEEIKIKPIIN